jgi:hypothetical protein
MRLAPNNDHSRACAAITVARFRDDRGTTSSFPSRFWYKPATMLTAIASMVRVLAFVWVIWAASGIF